MYTDYISWQTVDLCCQTKVGPYKFPWHWRGTRKCETILLCDGWVDDCWQTNHYSCNRLAPSSLLFIRQTVVYKQFRGGHVYDAQESMLTTMVHWDTNLQGTNATNKTCPDYTMHTNCMRKSLKSAVTQQPSNKHNKWHTHTLLQAYTGPPNEASVRYSMYTVSAATLVDKTRCYSVQQILSKWYAHMHNTHTWRLTSSNGT